MAEATLTRGTDAAPAPRRAGAPLTRRLAPPLIALTGLIALWQMLSAGPWAGLVAAPVDVATTLWSLLATGSFWVAVGETLLAALVGLGISVVLGVLLGIFLGRYSFAYRSARIPIEFLKPIPPVVVLPLALLVLGPSRQMSIVLIVFGCVFGILTQTMAGVRDVDPIAADMARTFHLGPVATLRRIVLPSASPFIWTAIRINGSVALIVAVVSELVGGAPGLGHDLLLAQSSGNVNETFAYVTFLGFVGLAVNGSLTAMEKRALHWHASVRGAIAA